MRRITIITALTILASFSLVLTSCKKNKSVTATTVEQAEAVPPAPPAPPAVADVPVPPVAPAAPQEESIVIEYRRTPCFGTCPIFNFKVYESGRALYDGKNFVDRIGTYYTNVTPEQVQKIMSVAEQIKFFQMQDVYDGAVTDLPSVHVSLKKNAETKTVKNRYQGPKELKTLYEELDSLIKSLNWLSADSLTPKE
jgi:(2Fe-2S) ferredoxin